MNFKQWLIEYEGDTFPQSKPDGEVDMVNDISKGQNSKYKGKGSNEEGQRADLNGEFDKIGKSYGFKPNNDPLLKLQKLMRKMRKMMTKG